VPINLRKPKPAAGPEGPDIEELLAQALAELAIDRPVLTSRLVGNRLELTLYGGDLIYWPPAEPKGR